MTWKTDQKPNIADECSYCDKGKATFILSDEILGVVKKLCDEVQTEWQMLLTGEERENNVVYLNGYYVPKQTVTGSTVSSDECMTLERVMELGVIATIHSHGNMSPFFSGVDEQHTNTSFIKNHIVVNNRHEFIGTKAIELPCGMKRFVEATVTRDMPVINMADSVEGIDKIEKKTYTCNWIDDDWIRGNGKRKKHSFQIERRTYE